MKLIGGGRDDGSGGCWTTMSRRGPAPSRLAGITSRRRSDRRYVIEEVGSIVYPHRLSSSVVATTTDAAERRGGETGAVLCLRI